ncbi:MAG: AAA family ATPase [Bacteroidota bacterium]
MDVLREEWLRYFLEKEEIQLTDDQEKALGTFLDFLRSYDDRSTLLLTGSAGTGKTFLINIFSRHLRKLGYKVILLAPTGRAAKVITQRSNRLAYTIHHHIYSPLQNGYDVVFSRKENKKKSKTVYIVDEASMIGDDAGGGGNNLLRDLLHYVFDGDPARRLIMVGDPVQLPPVGLDRSPGLDATALHAVDDLDLWEAHLKEVKRQVVDSGILEHAVAIRDAYFSETGESLHLESNRDVQVIDQPWEALETYLGYFEEGNPDRAVFITYSNYQATRINQAIRAQMWETEEKLVRGDLLMVVRNNYAWGDQKRFPFIANGEMGTVREVYPESLETRYGLEWMDVELEFIDARGEPILVNCKVVLSLLTEKHAQLPSETRYAILQARRTEYAGLSMSQATLLMRSDPYVQGLEVKYGYAITGHKSQGGQWENVLINFEPDYGQNLPAYIRWTYTVFTRATERVFLLNCPFAPRDF